MSLGTPAAHHLIKHLVQRITRHESLTATQILFHLERLSAEHSLEFDLSQPEIVAEIINKLLSEPTQALSSLLDYFFSSENLGAVKIDYVHEETSLDVGKSLNSDVTTNSNLPNDINNGDKSVITGDSTKDDDDDEWGSFEPAPAVTFASPTPSTGDVMDDDWGDFESSSPATTLPASYVTLLLTFLECHHYYKSC